MPELRIASRLYLRENPIGDVTPGVGVTFDGFTGVIPDLIFIAHKRRRRFLAEGRLMGAPEICMEILRPTLSR